MIILTKLLIMGAQLSLYILAFARDLNIFILLFRVSSDHLNKCTGLIKKLKDDMEEIAEQQKHIREGQREVRERFESIESECEALKRETRLIQRQSQCTQVKLAVMFGILKVQKKL